MSELFTPTTKQVSEAYEVAHEEVGAPMEPGEFDRWLDQVRREAVVNALKEELSELHIVKSSLEKRMRYGQRSGKVLLLQVSGSIHTIQTLIDKYSYPKEPHAAK